MIEIITPKGLAYVELNPANAYFNGKQFLPPARLDYLYVRRVPVASNYPTQENIVKLLSVQGTLCKVNRIVSSEDYPVSTLPWIEDSHVNVCTCTSLHKLSFVEIKVIQ